MSISDLYAFGLPEPTQKDIEKHREALNNIYNQLSSKKKITIVLSQKWLSYKRIFYKQQGPRYVCLLTNETCETVANLLTFEDVLYNNLEKLIQKLSNADFVIVGSLYRIKEFKSPLEFANLKHMPLSKLYAWYYQNYGVENLKSNFKYQNIDLAELKEIDTVFKRLEQNYSNVHFYDIREKLCNGNQCLTLTDDGQLIFWDNNHLPKAGAEFVGQGLVQKIQATLKQ